MMLTGADYASGALSLPGGVGFSDDMIIMPTHGATQWDALSHCFLDGKMYNGFDATEISSQGARKKQHRQDGPRHRGRGVLIDMPRFKGVPWLQPGYAITAADLQDAAAAEQVTIGSGDILLVRTGHIALCRDRKSWGDYAGGDAAGLSFHSAEWIHQQEIAAVATDTWGMEVRPNEIAGALHPLHQIFLPIWACRLARSSTWKSWRPTAQAMASTNVSWLRRLCQLPAPSDRRSIRWPSSNGINHGTGYD
jgi:kynurenine formamidase